MLVGVSPGGGITSKGSKIRIGNYTEAAMLGLEFFKNLLPTFCNTADDDSSPYVYRFYLAFDKDDPLFTSPQGALAFRKTFDNQTDRFCGPSIDVSLRLVTCRHSGRPAWAQNDAMIDAYLDGVDFFYRVNDDTRMVSSGWTNDFVETLAQYVDKTYFSFRVYLRGT